MVAPNAQVGSLKAFYFDHSSRALIAERINKLATLLSDGVYEREETIKLSLLSALAGESVFLLGPPGIAKSLIAKRLIQAFDDNSYFEYLMTRFSTPEEVFGPLSIQELKDNGRYLRLTQGYLPTAQVVFLDEIWKAGPAILNTLLTVVNEKTFKNGSEIERVPMRLLITASNELPDHDSGLDALYDRILLRLYVSPIKSKQNFKSMLTVGTFQEVPIPNDLKISDTEYYAWQRAFENIPLNNHFFDKLYLLKTQLESKLAESALSDSDQYISDRRWKKAIKLIKACAFFSGRDELSTIDILILENCLWNTPQSREVVTQVIQSFATNEVYSLDRVRGVIEHYHDEMSEIQQELEDKLSLEIIAESGSGLRRKLVPLLDLSNAKRYELHNSEMLCLALLRDNISVSEKEKGDARWIYIAERDLAKVVKEGSGDALGLVNENTTLCRLKLEVDSNDRVIVKDLANRSIPTCLVQKDAYFCEEILKYQESINQWQSALADVNAEVKRGRSEFNASLPHPFVDTDLIVSIDQEITTIANEIDNTIAKHRKFRDRASMLVNLLRASSC
ncbi:DUF3763 domain-containing protein [Vibrio sp. ZSDZ34]|uniref:DUF3763 domain-containing protein n=1 Tax=Vibrio gelatinilyticus TaxID=2893468 RepID=A0A9X1WI51_9VIBR|nr:AAA family ATPase [Vibrio gelatinilyticus]MCJ2377069.1 DUF3763 domain-containing protein [Vibrio gelatinilyticus]